MPTPGRPLLRAVLEAAWAPIAVLLLHALLARLFGHEPIVDPIMHLLGGAAAAFFVRHLGERDTRLLGAPSSLALDLLAFGLTSFVGLAWEVSELLSDRYLGSHAQTSVANTLRDLLFDVLGAAVYLCSARLARAAAAAASRGRPGDQAM